MTAAAAARREAKHDTVAFVSRVALVAFVSFSRAAARASRSRVRALAIEDSTLRVRVFIDHVCVY